MKIKTMVIDLVKKVFQMHGVDEGGRVALRKVVKLYRVLPFFSNVDPS